MCRRGCAGYTCNKCVNGRPDPGQSCDEISAQSKVACGCRCRAVRGEFCELRDGRVVYRADRSIYGQGHA
jgi:hypothetical protein